jgi:hypothetical protein
MTLEGNEINIIIDEITNCLIENATGKEVKTEVKKRSLFQPGQYKGMNFDWAKEFQNGFEGYVMFDAKTNLIEHYKKTLGALQVGSSQRMILNPKTSSILVQKYFPDQQKGW